MTTHCFDIKGKDGEVDGYVNFDNDGQILSIELYVPALEDYLSVDVESLEKTNAASLDYFQDLVGQKLAEMQELQGEAV